MAGLPNHVWNRVLTHPWFFSDSLVCNGSQTFVGHARFCCICQIIWQYNYHKLHGRDFHKQCSLVSIVVTNNCQERVSIHGMLRYHGWPCENHEKDTLRNWYTMGPVRASTNVLQKMWMSQGNNKILVCSFNLLTRNDSAEGIWKATVGRMLNKDINAIFDHICDIHDSTLPEEWIDMQINDSRINVELNNSILRALVHGFLSLNGHNPELSSNKQFKNKG